MRLGSLIGLFFSCSLIVAGCSSANLRSNDDPHIAHLGSGVTLDLTALEWPLPPLALYQQISFSIGAERAQMEALLEIAENKVHLSLLDQLGREAAQLSWSNSQLKAEQASWLSISVPPENLIADLALVYWPIAELTEALPSNVTVIEASGRRTINSQGKTLVIVEYSKGPGQLEIVTLENKVLGYLVTTQSTVLSP